MGEVMPPQNGWEEWKNHVLMELKRQNDLMEGIFAKLNRLSEEIAALKVKAGVWGLLGGAIPVLVSLCIYIILK